MASNVGIFLIAASENYQSSWVQKNKLYATYIDDYRNNILSPVGDFISKIYIVLQDDLEEKLQIQYYTFDFPPQLLQYKQHSSKIMIVDQLLQGRGYSIIVNRKCLLYTLQHQMNIDFLDSPSLITQSSEYEKNPLSDSDKKTIDEELYQYFTDEKSIIQQYLSSSTRQYHRYTKHNVVVSGTKINIAEQLKYQNRKIANILFTAQTKLKLSIHGIDLLLIKKRKAKLIYGVNIPRHSYLVVFHGFNLDYSLINYKPPEYLDINKIGNMILTSSAPAEIKIQVSYE